MNDQKQTYGKILHLGDMARVSQNLVSLLRNQGLDAHLLYYKSEIENIEKSPWIHCYSANANDKFHEIKIMVDTLKMIQDYKIVHAHSIFGIPLLSTRKRYLLHLHGTDVRSYAKQPTPLGLAIKTLIKKASIIVVSTPDLIKEVESFGKNSIFIPNPISFETFQPRRTLDHHSSRIKIFHPSRHSENKGNSILIKGFYEVIKSGIDAELTLVEWGDMVLESKRLINQLGIEENVNWIEKISTPEMNYYYHSSDIVCDQFVLGGLGQIALEAMACGKPVLANYSDTLMKSGYSSLPPFSPISNENEVFDTLMRLISKENIRNQVGDLNREWVAREHSYHRILGNLFYCYDKLVG